MKIVCFVCLAIIVMSSNVWASTFSITDTRYEILGRLQLNSTTFLQQFDITSSSAISKTITDTLYPGANGFYSYAQSSAGNGAFVSVKIDQGTGPYSEAEAIAIIDFTANFNGYADPILFYGWAPYETWFAGDKASWTINDLTSHSVVASNTAGNGPFSYALQYSGGGNYSWASSHLYELKMVVQTGSNHGTDQGSISTNMFSVPEPSSAILLAIGLAGVVAVKFMGYQPSFTRAARQPSRNSDS